jgi:hypothetical protein
MMTVSDSDRAAAESVEQTLFRILEHRAFVVNIIEALDASAPADLSAAGGEPRRRDGFDRIVGRVKANFDVHPRRRLLLLLLRDDSQLSDEELVDTFEFIYSYLVNQFKGELAELLAWPILNDFVDLLTKRGLAPAGTQVVPGSLIEERRAKDGVLQRGWYKGADALIVLRADAATGSGSAHLPDDSLAVIGVVEIKAYRPRRADVLFQLRNHVRRLSMGFRLSGSEVDPSRALVGFVERGGYVRYDSLTERVPVARLERLVIRPSRKGRQARPVELWGTRTWVAELVPDAVDLAEAGYRFADWFLGKAGAEVFRSPGEPGLLSDADRVPNPWPHMSPEEAARNALRQAMYVVGSREIFEAGRGRAAKRVRRARATFRWLYNALCYGYHRASGDHLQFPEEHPDLPRVAAGGAVATEELVPSAAAGFAAKVHRAYTKGHHARAKEMLQKAMRRDPTLLQGRRIAWIEGMIAYREARFEDALARFPGPESGKRDHWWTRDQVMLARLHARSGDGPTARVFLTALEPLGQWPNRALPVEVHAVESLSWLADRDHARAGVALESARQLLQHLSAEEQRRADAHLGASPDVNVNTMLTATLDLAAALAVLGQTTEATDELTQLGGLDGWEFGYIASDSLLSALRKDPRARSRVARWKGEESRR